ncbi:nicotinate (nicotinamide) nucleotide adenylyltransferase [Flavobacterium sp. CS20]|jgi:nicotinate-nucleotide adenylyltransferase|uniref:nicotinate (nicotinamide) nucleotide adenylyltransferase n=1 Tax=Flavobacterium sp. CS20 TaxID=2775246 RepID=UPI001B3A6A99|nr:nicotinate (nicotinamide) nucleotide adenylyltransferase [Flavobacterium sp. CS20]QTY26994.1 nicotinate-nucleotide adenylyltransferase [Flavobacterium sp. CS20]
MKKSKHIGLFFGTFNPIHIGHLIMANHIAEFSSVDEVWFVITPQSPFKQKESLLDNHHRYELVYRATEEYPKLKASKIEFDMPQPNYTSKTLERLLEKYPNYQFHLIMGEDNLASFKKWKNYDYILEHHHIIVCPRIHHKNVPSELQNHAKVQFVDVPIIEISASFIRKAISKQQNIKPLLPEKVWAYIDEMNFYR